MPKMQTYIGGGFNPFEKHINQNGNLPQSSGWTYFKKNETTTQFFVEFIPQPIRKLHGLEKMPKMLDIIEHLYHK